MRLILPSLSPGLSTQDLGATQSINATFSLKPADALKLNAVEAAAYPVVVSHFAANGPLGNALIGLNDEASFAATFDQILPQYGDATMLLQAAMLEGANGAVGERMRLVTSSAQLGSHGWAQQFGAYFDRSGTDAAPETTGNGLGFAFGPRFTRPNSLISWVNFQCVARSAYGMTLMPLNSNQLVR